MKFNFGQGILVVLLLFMAGMSALVYKCTKQSIDLVSNNYYEKELKYQNQIDKENQTLALSEDMQIAYDQEKQLVTFQYPGTFESTNISGKITFYKPDNASLDFEKPINVNKDNSQHVTANSLASGWWNVKVDWNVNAISYFKETKILVTN
jgi:nitrogen fixation protein FixH